MQARQSLSRRDVVKGAAASIGTAIVAPTLLLASKDKSTGKSPIVDTHLHCFAGSEDVKFPYHKQAPYRPEPASTPQRLLECMDGADVDYAVVVHPEPYQDDHRYLEYCLNVGKQRLKGTCLFFCDRPGSLEKMAPLVKAFPNQIVAARLHSYAPGRLPPFDRPELIRKLWKTASDLGLAMQLHFEPRYAPQLEPFIKEFPKTTVIIDHMGRPFQGTPKEHAVVVRWSRFPNTIIKLASIPAQNRYPHREIGPIIKSLIDAYGAERTIYGGGFGADATPQSYRAYRDRVRGYIAHLNKADQAQVLGRTAARIYRFGDDS